MGKAIIVSITILIIFLTVAILIYRANKHSNIAPEMGDFGLKQERQMRQLLDRAASVMRGVGGVDGYQINQIDILSDRSRESVNAWLLEYDTFYQKEINA